MSNKSLKLKNMSKKIKLTIKGVNYELPKSAVVLKGSTQWEDETYIQMRAKYCSSIIKQYVKKNFPLLNVWATSSVYSGGSSCDIYVSNQDGSSVDKDIYEQIENFSQLFKGGSFNGMEDIYEYRNDNPTTDNGTPMKYFPSYVFVNNKRNHYHVNAHNNCVSLFADDRCEEGSESIQQSQPAPQPL